MAVTGIFQADFGSFFDAVEQADVKLRDLDTGAANVEKSMSRMANSFSGQKIITDASMMARIFEEAGGAAAFTEKELARMGATAAEAIEKMEAIGQDVPDNLRKMADATKGATKETESLTTSIANFATGFVAMKTVTAAWDFVTDIAATAGALSDLSAQTRIGVEDLQIMGQAMATFGVSTEEMGRAIFTLSQRIAKGDDSVAVALRQMGTSLEEVRGLNGEALFTRIQNGLAGLHGELRDTTAVELYGTKLGMAMAGASEGTNEAIRAARELNTVMSKETVEALDAASEAIEQAGVNLTNMAAGPIAEVATAFNKVHDAMRGGASGWETFKALLADIGTSWDNNQNSAANLNAILERVNQSTRDFVGPTQEAAQAASDFVGPLENETAALRRANAETERRVALMDADEAAAKKRQEQNERGIMLMERDAELNAARAEFDAGEKARLDARAAAGAGFVAAMTASAKATREQAEAEKALIEEQKKLDAELAALQKAHNDAGKAAADGTQTAVEGYQQVQTQVEITGDAIRAWIDLMKYSAQVNAILKSGSGLFTTAGQYESIANLSAPSFATGVENFAGGVAKVHRDELLVNLPSGTTVIPKARTTPDINVSNTFNMVDTESNLVRRVSESIMRTVRAGTQLGTTA